MSSITELQELTQKGQEQFLEAVRESQQAVVDAVGAWAQTVQGIASTVPPVPGTEQLPSAEALAMPADTLLRQAGLLDPEPEDESDPQATEASIRADPALSDAQKEALLTVYRSYRRTEADAS